MKNDINWKHLVLSILSLVVLTSTNMICSKASNLLERRFFNASEIFHLKLHWKKKKNQIVCLLSKKYCYGQMYISWQPQLQFWLTIWELRPSRKRALNVHSQCHIFIIRNINSFNQGLRNRANLNMHTLLSLISLHFPNSIYKNKLIN